MFRRYIIVGYVRDHGMHRYLDQPAGFLTHSGALIAATRAIRNGRALGHLHVEWHPIRKRAKVRTGQSERWVRVVDLPVWNPYRGAPEPSIDS